MAFVELDKLLGRILNGGDTIFHPSLLDYISVALYLACLDDNDSRAIEAR
jgi:hypothetical protein